MTTQSSSFCCAGFVEFVTLSDADALMDGLNTGTVATHDISVVLLTFVVLLAEEKTGRD